MEIKTSFISRKDGQKVNAIYKDIDDVNELMNMDIQAVHCICFYGDKMVLVYEKDKGQWNSPGGMVEKGESVEQAVIREVKEETNMRVINQAIIGVQTNISPTETFIQTRTVCLVEPYGDFIADPGGDVTEIKLIDPADYAKYYYWGANSDRMMERALKKVKTLNQYLK
jgi:8-oxo-dGTP diphosphatase